MLVTLLEPPVVDTNGVQNVVVDQSGHVPGSVLTVERYQLVLQLTPAVLLQNGPVSDGARWEGGGEVEDCGRLASCRPC